MDWITITTISCVGFCYIVIGIQVSLHLLNYTNPNFQNKIIMILLMPPIYSTLSTLSIVLNDANGYLLLIRDIYESIVIYAFFLLLRAYAAHHEKRR